MSVNIAFDLRTQILTVTSAYVSKLLVWLKLERCDRKVENLCRGESFDVMEKLKV